MTTKATSQVSSLGVIGDVHAEDSRLSTAINHLQSMQVDAIVCTGDIVDGIGCPNESARLLRDANVITVRGNHDRWILEHKARHIPDAHFYDNLEAETRTYLENLSSQAIVETIQGRLMLCHGIGDDDLRKVWPGTERMPIERSRALDDIITGGEVRFLINGHMHFRTLIHFEALTLINAGTLKGEYWPGFSLINFESHEITAFEFIDDEIREVTTQKLTEDHHVVWTNTQSFSGGWDPVRLF
jgi:predicted phosphodiesterase